MSHPLSVRRMSLATRLVLLLLASILPALAIQGYNEYDLRRSREDDIRQRVVQITKQFGEEMGELREGARQMLLTMGQIPAVKSKDGPACDAILESLKRRFVNYTVLGAADTKGNVFCASTPGDRDSVASLPFFERAMAGDALAVGNYWVDPKTKQQMIHFALRVDDEAGKPAGVVFAGLDLAWLSEHLKERGLTPTQSILIADRLGNIIARLPHPEALVGKNMRKSHEAIMDGVKAGWEEAAGVDGVTRIFGYVPAQLFPHDFFLSAGQEKGAAFKPIDQATMRGVALIALGFLLAVLGAWQGSRIFVKRPINVLMAAVSEWQKGNLKARAAVDTGSEIGDLGTAFNDMADALDKEVEAQLRAEENLRRLNATLEERVAQRTQDLALAAEKLQREMKEREKAQADLLHAQKIEAIGQLTSGIAHDFNNLLTAVLGNLDVARRRNPDERTLRAIDTATRAAKRGAKLIGDLLAFSRRQRLDPEPVAVNELIEKNDEMLRRSIGSGVLVTRNLAPGIWPAITDPAQLELAVLNLAINARDAMQSGGKLTISTENVAAGDPRLPADLTQGDYVMVALTDTGSGMTEEVKNRVFEPFFTTKEIGKGTGLGLSMVYGFVQQCAGGVRVESKVGEGTTVAMFFPRGDATAAGGADVDAQASERGTLMAKRPGTAVLVVDDDVEVREFAAAALGIAGYEVFTAGDAWTALEILDREKQVALLVTDFAMPVVTGIALLTQVHRERPELATLLITGIADVPLDELAPDKRRMLQKPFDIDELLHAVAAALETAPADKPQSLVA